MRPSADSPALQNTEEPSPLQKHTHTNKHTQEGKRKGSNGEWR